MPSLRGSSVYPAFLRFFAVNSAESRMMRPPRRMSPRFAAKAAGFMTTKTSGWSPGVAMS